MNPVSTLDFTKSSFATRQPHNSKLWKIENSVLNKLNIAVMGTAITRQLLGRHVGYKLNSRLLTQLLGMPANDRRHGAHR
jgi:hypothetical protein